MPTCPICETNVRDDENAAVLGTGYTLVHPDCISPELGDIALEEEALIQRTIAMGAGNRETALRWLDSDYVTIHSN